MAKKPTYEELEQKLKDFNRSKSKMKRSEKKSRQNAEGLHANSHVSNIIQVSGIKIAWDTERGTCSFENLPVAMMWVDTTLAGLMSGVQTMVGTERFALALQREGRKSVEADWQVISQYPDFREGFKAIANIAGVAGWGNWVIVSLNEEMKECRFRVTDSWEGRYQKALGECWGSAMLAGKMAGYCSKLFGTNCWADQTAFVARGEPYDEFVVKPSPRSIEREIEGLLASDEATRADMAVALRKLEKEIAERSRMEEALRESEARLKRSQEIAKLGSWELDLVNKRLTWSDEVYRIFGLQPQQFGATYEAFLEAVHPDDRAAVDAAYSGSICEGRDNYEIEHRVVRKSTGEIRIVHEKCEHIRDASGRIIRSIGMVHDITDRKRAEEAVRNSEENLRAIFQSTEEAIISLDREQRCLQANPAAGVITGVPHDQLIGRFLPEFVDPSFNLTSAWEDFLNSGRFHGELRIRHSSGSFRIVEASGIAHIGPGRHLFVGHDITGRKQMEEALTKSRDELEQRVRERTAELELRNKELQDFAFVASHDLQEPLRKVQTFGKMLAAKCGVSLDETSSDYIDRMEKAAARMQTLLNSLLSYSRVTTKAETIKDTDLRKSVKSALSNLEIMIKEMNARVEVGELPRVWADRVQMMQLFQNLIGNALKFSREGDPPHVKIYAEEVGDAEAAYEIYVEDNGIGFDERYLDKIFLPFQRLHGRSSEFEGVGMGLAICRKIVERHGGKITARSEPGKGSTFIATLPAKRKVR